MTGLCYTRCTWATVEGRGVVRDRAPGTCWEGAHNALLQAAAPALYEALHALVRGEVGAMGRAEATLKAIEDQAWLDFVENPGTAELTPQQVMEMACGLDGQDAGGPPQPPTQGAQQM